VLLCWYVFNPLSKDAQDVNSDEMKVLEEEIEAMKDEHSNGQHVSMLTNIHVKWGCGTNVCTMQ
jgi:hypothetical protein